MAHTTVLTQRAWTELIEAVKLFINNHGGTCKFVGSSLAHSESTSGIFKFWTDRLVEFKDVKFKPVSNNINKRCNLYLSGEFQVSENYEVTSYTTWMSCFSVSNNPAETSLKRLEGYHFDMEENSSIGHPVFHLQRDCTIHSREVKDSENINIEEDPTGFVHKSIRIPSCQLDIFSAMIMIVANHFAKESCNDDFMHLVIKSAEKSPIVNMDKNIQLKRCLDSKAVISHYWY